MRNFRLLTVLVFFLGVSSAWAQSDKFELKPMWALLTQFGSIGLSTDQHHGGNSALFLSSTSGGQRYIQTTARHPSAVRGTWSVWFLDTAAGSETLYSGLRVFNSADPDNIHAAVNVADWNATHYVWRGPGFGQTSTSVPRTNGWHLFKIQLTATGFSASIDGTLLGTVAGDFTFDTVEFFLSGPVWRPNATFWFDDFKYTKPR